MKNLTTAIVLFLFFSGAAAYAQIEKLPVNFYYNTKSGRNVDKEMVNLTFMVTGIKDQAQYEQLYGKFSRQDGVRKVVMAPYDATQESALCTFSFKKPLKPDYLQKVLTYMGVESVYIDEHNIPTSSLTSFLSQKQKQREGNSGK